MISLILFWEVASYWQKNRDAVDVHLLHVLVNCIGNKPINSGGRTGLVVRASDSGLGDPGSILGRVGVLFP